MPEHQDAYIEVVVFRVLVFRVLLLEAAIQVGVDISLDSLICFNGAPVTEPTRTPF